ncbi:g3037 [Coccomyxa elongata]
MDSSAPPSAVTSQGPLSAAANRFKDLIGGIFKERKPWAELADRTAFSRPATLSEATGRLRKNAHYFKVNYLIVMLSVTFITLALNPTSLIALAFLTMAWVYLFVVRQAPIVIGGRTFSEREKFIGISIITVIVIFFLTSVGTVLFTALGISVAAIALHGSFRVPDDLFTDEIEGTSPDLLSFLTAPAAALSMAAASVAAETKPAPSAAPAPVATAV